MASKTKRQSKFSSDWITGEYKVWLTKSPTDSYHAFCKLCKTEFSVGNGGFSNVKSHHKSAKHLKRVQDLRENTQISAALQAEIETTAMTLADQVTHAETIWLFKVVKNDISLNTNTGSGQTFAAMFPDSEIAKKFQLGPNKASYMIRFGLGPYCREELDRDISCAVSYSIQFDETTTSQVVKQMDIVVRYWSETANEVVTRYFDSLKFGHAPADKVTNELHQTMDDHSLDLKKLITFGRDGPNVNKKIMKLFDKAREDIGESKLVDIGPCILHVVHNAFREGLDVFEDVEQLIIDLNQWFNTSYSACRREDYGIVQIEEAVARHVLLKHVNTRWLTLKPAVDRILEQWTALVKYFKSLEKEKSKRYACIRRVIDDPTTPASLQFISQLSTNFMEFERMFQTNEPLVHRLFEAYKELYTSHISKFVVATETKKKVEDMDLNKSVPLKDIVVGYETQKAMEKLQDGLKKTLLLKIRDCYTKTAKYLKSHFPNNPVLKALRCLDPLYVKHHKSMSDIRCVVDGLGHHLSATERNNVESEWTRYRTEFDMGRFPEEWMHEVIRSEIKFRRVDHYWRNVFALKTESNQPRYPALTVLIKTALGIPHSNAAVERSLSVNKNILSDNRSLLHSDTSKGIRYSKGHLEFHDPDERRPEKVPYTPKLQKYVRSSRSSYQVYLEDEKQKAAAQKKDDAVVEETRKAYNQARIKVKDAETKMYELRAEERTAMESVKVSQNIVQ